MNQVINQLVLCIDAHNIRAGGGITHLSELLKAADPNKFDFKKVIVLSGSSTLDKLPKKEWLELRSHPYLEKNIIFRLIWLFFLRRKILLKEGCSLLFVPGGTDFSGFQPIVTMSQNLLPFEKREARRYGFGFKWLKFIILRLTQTFTFKKAEGIIFLTDYAFKAVLKLSGPLKAKCTIIPHGINPKFFSQPQNKSYRSFDSFSAYNPCKLIYVSVVEIYKHQWQVVKAVHLLRKQGYHVNLDLVGPPGPGTPLLQKSIDQLKGDVDWLTYHGAVSYDHIQNLYKKADIGIFASSCETYGQIVSEAMAASLPLACSGLSAMKDVIGENAVYFHPENPLDIAEKIIQLLQSLDLRKTNAEKAFEVAKNFTWERAADSSFDFFKEVYCSFNNKT